MNIKLDDTFNVELPADPIKENTRRQVEKAAYSFVSPRKPSRPLLLHASDELAHLLGMSEEDFRSESFLKVFSGDEIISNSNPYAMCYGGHQFGHWAGQLGDGRAINLGETVVNDQRWAMQLKGAGATPYSRSADGLAVLRSSIREHLCSEAMYHLGVPTTRSLSLMLSGDEVMRDIMYDGNPEMEKGAIVCRVAPTFLRFGNFQIFTARRDVESLKIITDYTIRHFFPEIKSKGKDAYLEFLKSVLDRTFDMVIEWQRVGFVHGVMNTDNMSILGLTIDYGPYGWLEGYDHNWTPNTTDREGRRYRYNYQPRIALWNLLQLANALYPLIEDVEPIEEILHTFNNRFNAAYIKMMCAKIGLFEQDEDDNELIKGLEKMLHFTETDMTIFFRNLAHFKAESVIDFKGDFLEPVKEAFYNPGSMWPVIASSWKDWFDIYKKRLVREGFTDHERKIRMNQVNPKYVLRNYMAQLAIDEANKGQYTLIDEFYQLLKKPYDEQPAAEKWFAKRPEWARHKVGCSMLSCSS